MQCDWEAITGSETPSPIEGDSRVWRSWKCRVCLRETKPTPDEPERIDRNRPCRMRPDIPGVGTELRKIFGQLGFKAKNGCGCAEMIREMNQLGPDGCEANLECFVRKLRKSYETTTAMETARGTLAAITTGLAWKLDWTDPIPSLVRLAIARARAL